MGIVITGVNSITAVGHTAEMTAASVRAGISRLAESVDYLDVEGNPITVGSVEGISDEEDEVTRTRAIAMCCLEGLFQRYFKHGAGSKREVHLLLGVAASSRPGPEYGHIAEHLLEFVRTYTPKVTLQMTASGNPAAIRCLERARRLLSTNPTCLCVVGGVDSLLASDTLDFFEESERLKSESFGRNQGFAPAEAVGFMFVESKENAIRERREVLAELAGIGLAQEPAPFLSELPSKGEGLTAACKIALSESGERANTIRSLWGDLDGEFFRAKMWGYAEVRCFGNSHGSRRLWHPADCWGSVGAASGIILMNMATVALARGWIREGALVFCSDDSGECGVSILRSCSN